MSGLPEHLPEEGLHKQLKLTMAALGIPEDAYSCEKHKRRAWAAVTFGEEKQGRLFLQKHGEKLIHPSPPKSRQPSVTSSTVTHGHASDSIPAISRNSTSHRSRAHGSVNGSVDGSISGRPNQSFNPGSIDRPQRKARLQLMGNDIFCKISKDLRDPKAGPKKPNPITLRGLKHAAEERVNPTHKRQTDGAPEVFTVHSISCGHNVWDGHQLVFVPEAELEDIGIAKFTKQVLIIKLASKHVIKIPLDTVVHLVCSVRRALILTLSEEPSFFLDTTELTDHFHQLSLAWGSPEKRNPVTRTRVCSLDQRHAEVVGHCLVYQLQIAGSDLDKRIQALKYHDVVSGAFERFDLVTQRTPPVQLGPTRSSMKALMTELASFTKSNALPFGILYQLQALAWNAYLHPGTVVALTRKLRQLYISDKDAGRRPISVDAFKMLFKKIDWPSPRGDPGEFEVSAIIELLRDNEDKFSRDVALRQGLHSPSQNLALVHRVVVTPSRTTLHGPELEAKNRILRKFPDHHESFIRVQFCDENGLDLFFNPKISYDPVYAKFRGIIRDGIQIAGRVYSFLGFSHSSLRSHSAWVGCEAHRNSLIDTN